jgi:hypothetical protein
VIIVGGESRYKAIRITPEIYNASNSDLSDLLIKDGRGEDVPYFINAGARQSYASTETYPMELINAYVKDGEFYFDYRLAEARGGDTAATSLAFTTADTAFAKLVGVYGSYDNTHWEYVQDDKLYAVDGKAKLEIAFAQPQKYTHYRLRLANNQERISFQSAELVYSVETVEETYFIETIAPMYSVESGERHTDIHIEGLRNLRLCDATIGTGSMFMRTASASDGTWKEIYNLTFGGAAYADTTIPFNRFSPWRDDAMTVNIEDGDDKPIAVDGISVRYYADELVFEGKAGEAYTLEFGMDASKPAPVYDIERYKADVLQGPVDRAAIVAVAYAPSEAPGPERDYKMVFNIVIVAVAALLGAVIVLKLKKGAPKV